MNTGGKKSLSDTRLVSLNCSLVKEKKPRKRSAPPGGGRFFLLRAALANKRSPRTSLFLGQLRGNFLATTTLFYGEVHYRMFESRWRAIGSTAAPFVRLGDERAREEGGRHFVGRRYHAHLHTIASGSRPREIGDPPCDGNALDLISTYIRTRLRKIAGDRP